MHRSLALFAFLAALALAWAARAESPPPAPSNTVECFEAGAVIFDGRLYRALVCDGGVLVFEPIDPYTLPELKS